MSMPAVPGAGFVVIEAEFVLGGLEAVLNSPAMAFHRDQLFCGCALGAPSGEEGQSTIGNAAAHQQPSRPLPGEDAVVFSGLEIGEFEIGPVVQACALRSVARRQAPPRALGKLLCDLDGSATNKLILAPGPEHAISSNAQHIPFAGLAQQHLDVAR